MYARLGLSTVIDDHVFRDLVISRVIEPASKLIRIRILDELGLTQPSKRRIHRFLNRAEAENCRDRFSQACVMFRGAEKLTLELYDVTTLFFQIEQDEYHKPGLSKES